MKKKVIKIFVIRLRKGEKRMGLLYNNYKSIYNELNFKPRILTMDDLKDINVSEDVKKSDCGIKVI